MSLTSKRVFINPSYDQNANPLDNQYTQIMHTVESFIITSYSKEELAARHAKVLTGLNAILAFHTSEAEVTNE